MSISEFDSLLTYAEVDVALSSAQHQHVLNALGLRLLRCRRALAFRRTVQHAAVEGGENVACSYARKKNAKTAGCRSGTEGRNVSRSRLCQIVLVTRHGDEELDGVPVTVEAELGLCHGAVGDEAAGALLCAVVAVHLDDSSGGRGGHLIG